MVRGIDDSTKEMGHMSRETVTLIILPASQEGQIMLRYIWYGTTVCVYVTLKRNGEKLMT